MLVNVISESQWFPALWGGIHTAFLNNVQALQKAKVNFVINSFGGADITHIHSVGVFGLVKLFTSKRVIVTAHMTPGTQSGTFKLGKFGYKMTEWYLKEFYNRADVVIVFSEKVKEDLVKIGVKNEMVFIPNPISSDFFKKNLELRAKGREEYKIPETKFVALSMGHAVLRKGIVDFIKVATDMPDITFVWVGSKLSGAIGSEDEELNTALKNAPTNFILTGRVTYDKMPMFYNMADVFFFPSYRETFGMGVVEAADCGVPVVLRDVPDYKELFGDSYASATDNEGFKSLIQKLQTDKAYYQQMSDHSLGLANKFSLETIGGALKALYERIAAKK